MRSRRQLENPNPIISIMFWARSLAETLHLPYDRGSANNVYVIAAPTKLTFGTATLLAASRCIPAVLSLVSMLNKIPEITFKTFRMDEEGKCKYEPSRIKRADDPLLTIMKRLEIYVKIFLATAEIPVFGSAIFLNIFLGERNFLSPQVSYQTQSIVLVSLQYDYEWLY